MNKAGILARLHEKNSIQVDYEDQPVYPDWIKDSARLSDEKLRERIDNIHQIISAGGERMRQREKEGYYGKASRC